MEKLAILGGKPLIDSESMKVEAPVVPRAAYEKVNKLMEKGEISASPIVGEFERKFASYIGAEYGLCVCNGTTSIQAALFAVGVGAGDEVIVPSFTFWASVGPVIACNALPVFADVDLKKQTLTAETIEKCITSKTKAILLVHTWGTPCEIEPIIKLAKEKGLKIVEDCSHAHGATYHEKKVGSFGDVGCFSLQGSKVLPAGEGGILVTNNREYFERACALGHYERLAALPEDSEYRQYSLTGLGYKHRVHPLGIAIADAGLDMLDEINEKRFENGKYLDDLLSKFSFLEMQEVPDDAKRVYAYHYARYIPENLKGLSTYVFLKALAAEGIVCGSCGYGRLHTAPLYTGEGKFGHGCPISCPHYAAEYTPAKSLPNTELLAVNDVMVAPRFEVCGKDAVELYAQAYFKVAENVDALLEYEKENALKDAVEDNAGRSINIVGKK